jgi:hypothetical protein
LTAAVRKLFGERFAHGIHDARDIGNVVVFKAKASGIGVS